MKSRNSGLGCGCSSGTNGQGMGEIPVFQPVPSRVPVVKPSYPMTATLTTGRQSLAPMSPSQVWMQFFREGMAFGVAWAASLEQGRTVSAQWHRDLERAAQNTAIPTSPTGAVASNRDAFVAGFDFGIRIVMERRIEITAPNGRRYSLDFLRTQGRVAANNLFGQTRPAILPAIAGPTGMAPATPGVAQVSTYDRLLQLARMAPSGISVRGWDSSAASAWVSFLFGRSTINPPPAPAAISLSPAVLARIQSWAQDFLNRNRGSISPAVEAFVRAIAATPWAPQASTGGTYYTGVSNCGPGEVRNPDGSCTRLS